MILYQTIEDRDNPDEIERNAPYLCKAKNAWLGNGYYFWDTLIENAHWWGNSHYYGSSYVIVQYSCDELSCGKCFDLQGNLEHLKQFNSYLDLLKKESLISEQDTVAKVFEFLKNKTDFLDRYEAIRAYGHRSKKHSEFVSFEKNKPYGLERFPAIQLCLFKKNSLNLSCGTIVYPECYCSGYVM
mgnify:FL=1